MVSVPEAIRRKYEDESSPSSLSPSHASQFVPSSSPLSPIFVPLRFSSVPRPASILILNDCDISCAATTGGGGEDEDGEEELRQACRGVEELDLAENKLSGWIEVSKILRHCPALTFLNLSFNNLGDCLSEEVLLPELPFLTKLVLINVGLDWRSIHRLIRSFSPKRLEELHLSMNNLDTVLLADTDSDSGPVAPYSGVRCLYLSKNPLSHPDHLGDLGLMFPNLRWLVMAECPLTGLGDPRVLKERFRHLERLNLDGSRIGSWEELEKVRVLENLVDLRIMGVRAFEEYTSHERRQQMVARLDNVTRLNGSAITRSEREDAERAFIRGYLDKEEGERPERYSELVARHGELNPLVDIDLSPRTEVTVSMECEGSKALRTVSVYLTVSELKQVAEKVFGIPPSRQKMFYVDQGMKGAYGPEEMRFGQKKLYSYNVQNGDEFIVQSKK